MTISAERDPQGSQSSLQALLLIVGDKLICHQLSLVFESHQASEESSSKGDVWLVWAFVLIEWHGEWGRGGERERK